MRKGLVIAVGFIPLLTVAARAQESRSEVSAPGTGFFTKDSDGRGISRTNTNTGGFILGYRYHISRWLSAEGNYSFDRDSQKYFSSSGDSRVKSDVHAATAELVMKLPLRLSKFSPYVLAGGGAFLYGGGAD
jgi:opacity protein-like surface antigen